MMRVVGGRLRGRTLAAPKSQAIRPTADRLRESLFNVLLHAYGDPISDARVLEARRGSVAGGAVRDPVLELVVGLDRKGDQRPRQLRRQRLGHRCRT